jgi:hypothetical protein
MFLHRFASSSASHTLRVCGLVAAYALVLVTGTAVVIGAFGANDGQARGPDVQQLTAAEPGVQAADAFLLASRNIPNDKRGF